MPAAKDMLSTTQENGKNVFDSFNVHCHGTRIDTKTTVLNLLRKTYPGYHVTEVTANYTNDRVCLFDFAAAGKATFMLDSEDGSFNATRKWQSFGERIEKKLHPGQLADEFRFARFQYIWDNKEFLVYSVVWGKHYHLERHMYYILHPRNERNIVDGHCIDTDALILAAGKWSAQLHEEFWVFDNSHWQKSKDLWKAVNGSSWSDIILDPEMKKSLIEDVHGFFDNQQVYSDFNVPWKRGLILYGVAGNGKTASIKALMSSLYDREDQIPSLYVKAFEDDCGKQNAIRQIFLQARQCAPCLLVFEDLDSLVGDDTRSYFLNQVDGLESNDGILMIGSTNHLDRIDPAIAKRPSRFDRKYHFKLPGVHERTAYVDYWKKKLLKNDTVDFPDELCPLIAKLTEGFSFAYLKELFVMALLSLVRGFKGDDFEIVEAEEADRAKEEVPAESTSSKTTADDRAESDETDTCAKKCDTCAKLFANEADEGAEKKEEAKKNKTVMRTVEVPDYLVDNLFLKVVEHQIRILRAEMDSTDEEK